MSCFVTGFLPYFYVTYPKDLSDDELVELKDVVNQKMISEFNRNPTLVSFSKYFDENHPPVVEISRANAKELTIFGLHSPKSNPVKTVLKICCKLTRYFGKLSLKDITRWISLEIVHFLQICSLGQQTSGRGSCQPICIC